MLRFLKLIQLGNSGSWGSYAKLAKGSGPHKVTVSFPTLGLVFVFKVVRMKEIKVAAEVGLEGAAWRCGITFPFGTVDR